MSKRIEWIDVAKGIGIILVVIGHVFPDASAAEGIGIPFYKFVYELIYSFHMPLFIFLSAILGTRLLEKMNSEQIRNFFIKKARRLLIPYFCIGILYIPFRLILSRYANSSFAMANLWKIFFGFNPYSGLWFLWALFMLNVVAIIIFQFLRINNKWFVIVGSFFLLIITLLVNIPDPYYWIAAYLFYFLFGLYKDDFIALSLKVGIVPSAVVLITVVLIRFYTECIVVLPIAAISGIITIINVSMRIEKKSGKLKELFTLFGDYSMDIYMLHGPLLVAIRICFWNIFKLPYMGYCILALLLCMYVCIMISKLLIRKNSVLNYIVLGNKLGSLQIKSQAKNKKISCKKTGMTKRPEEKIWSEKD